MITAGQQMAEQANANKNKDVFGSIIYNVKTYGAKGDNSTDDTSKISSAITAASVTGGIVFLPPGTYITGNLTVPSNVTIWFANGAKLSVTTGSTVTINGPIEAGLYQIFSGVGLIRGTPLVEKYYPEWWGAKGDNNVTLDNSAYFQKAIDHITLGSGGILYVSKGTYWFTNGLTINYGTGYSPLKFIGETQAKTVFVFNSQVGTFLNVNPVAPRSGNNTLGISYFELRDFSINGYNPTNTAVGIKIGKPSYVCDSFAWNQVTNVLIRDFGEAIRVESARHILFMQVVVRTPYQRALALVCSQNDDFTGDLKFINCEFASGTDMAIIHYNTAPTDTGGIGGIHYDGCDIYGNAAATQTIYFLCPNGGGCADTWFNNCALDQGNNIAFSFNIAGTARNFQFNINNCYVVGFSTFLQYTNSSTSVLKGDMTINGCMVGVTPLPINMGNAHNVIFEGNFFKDVSQKSLIGGNSKNIQILGNRFEGNLLANQCVQLAATVQSAIVKDNFGNFANASTFVENLTALPATKLVISDNLQYV